jgi:GNAT superfamily N-acetyltransferase
MTVTIRRLHKPAEMAWAERLLTDEFGGRDQARRGELMDPLAGEVLVAELDGLPAGFVSYLVSASGSAPEAEIQALLTIPRVRGQGVGSALLDAARGELRVAGVRRIWLVTTNDNLDALGFFQRRGWRLAAARPGAVDEARRTLKPSIGEVGANGIPIRDELDLELRL